MSFELQRAVYGKGNSPGEKRKHSAGKHKGTWKAIDTLIGYIVCTGLLFDTGWKAYPRTTKLSYITSKYIHIIHIHTHKHTKFCER